MVGSGKGRGVCGDFFRVLSDYDILHNCVHLETVMKMVQIPWKDTHPWNTQHGWSLSLGGLDEPELRGSSDLTLVYLYLVAAQHLDKRIVDLRA